MRRAADPDFEPPFTVAEPLRQTVAFVFNAPHSGNVYPHSFILESRLDAITLRRSEDAYVDELFAGVVGLGAPLMSARFPRAYLDVNREPYELDPRMFDGRVPSFANTRSMRVAGGLGTVPRIVADGHEIYRGRIGVDEALRRVDSLYKPYHRQLRQLITRTARVFGHAVLVDCHSMPSSSLGRDDWRKVDMVIGDRYGTSCAPELTDAVELALVKRGYTVVRNRPYAGGFITEHYGEPPLGRHALQIEVNRGIYMDERTLVRKKAGFDALRHDLPAAFAGVVEASASSLAPIRFAAE
jgi:N-formylglutamate amidohydrolase